MRKFYIKFYENGFIHVNNKYFINFKFIVIDYYSHVHIIVNNKITWL